MTIVLPRYLPAASVLQAEGLEVFDCSRLQEVAERPLRIALVNLMPDKQGTERQIGRVLGTAARPVELVLAVPDGYRPKNAPPAHMAAFYRVWSDLDPGDLDGVIVTGAPIEHLRYEEVYYWQGLVQILEDARLHALHSLHICWAAQALLWHFHGVPKHMLPSKSFGVFKQEITSRDAPVLAGLGRSFATPVSRHSEVRISDLPVEEGLEVLAASGESGLCLIEHRQARQTMIFNHLEYEAGTLDAEYKRDLMAGQAVRPPRNYYGTNGKGIPAGFEWRPHAKRFFDNWLAQVAEGASNSRPPRSNWPMSCVA